MKTTKHLKRLLSFTKSILYIYKKLSYDAKKLGILFLIFQTVTVGFPILINYARGNVIDALTVSIQINSVTNALISACIVYLIYVTLRYLNNSSETYFEYMFAMAMDRDTDLILAKKYSHIDIPYFEDPKFNNLLTRVKENISRVRAFSIMLVNFLSLFIASIATFFVIATFSVPILLLLILTNVPSLVTELKFGRIVWSIWQDKGDFSRMYTLTRNLLLKEDSLKEVKVFGTSNFMFRKIKNAYDTFFKSRRKIESKRIIYSSLLSLISLVGYGISFAYLVNRTVIGEISIGQFTFYLTTIMTLSGFISGMFSRASKMYEFGLAITDTVKLLEIPSKIQSGKRKLKNTSKGISIEFNNVSFAYPNSKKKVFENLNLKICQGEHIAIVGENGAGKSTLVSLIQRFYEVDQGDILVNGVSLSRYDINSWYDNIAFLSQEYVKYHFDSETNIYLGNVHSSKNKDKIVSSAKIVGANKFIEKYPKKYKQLLSKRFDEGVMPSEGQWQKIALARAFYKDAPILILDEPTSAIDPKAEFEIFEKLFDYAKDKTVIIISHRFSTVRNADRIIVIDDGKIVEEGSHKELLALNGMYKEAYDLQKKGYEDV